MDELSDEADEPPFEVAVVDPSANPVVCVSHAVSASSVQEDSAHSLDRRDDVDGLRAIAVVSVIIYHMDKSWL